MREIACLFGSDQHLSGIVTEPNGEAKEALILISAGLLPKHGPYRLYAEIARAVAEDGRLVLRFDLGGIGDSGLGSESGELQVRTAVEVQQALDLIASRYQITRFTLGGLCSGAEDALRAAVSDARVTGVLMIDPFAYRTSGWFWRHLIFRGMRRLLRAAGMYTPLHVASRANTPSRPRVVVYEYMSHIESHGLLQQLIARGVGLHLIYTGGMREHFNHTGQFRKMYPDLAFGELLKVDFIKGIDHTAPRWNDRRLIIENILEHTFS
jgi:hypothetical protein